MSEKIEPALTAEQWRLQVIERGDFEAHLDPGLTICDIEAIHVPEESRYAVAALALYGQPFGFTREDVVFLNALSVEWRILAESMFSAGRGQDAAEVAFTYERLISIADRIEALLPPDK